VSFFRSSVLLCDDDRDATDALTADLRDLGHAVTTARSCADTFAAACTYDFDALVAAPFLRDGSALVLPAALGIRKPRLVVLTSRLSERLAPVVTRRVGFDVQLIKVIDARRVDLLLRASLAQVAAATLETTITQRTPQVPDDPEPPASEVGARGPR
jgi:DNA-binding response OmpR family regulator